MCLILFDLSTFFSLLSIFSRCAVGGAEVAGSRVPFSTQTPLPTQMRFACQRCNGLAVRDRGVTQFLPCSARFRSSKGRAWRSAMQIFTTLSRTESMRASLELTSKHGDRWHVLMRMRAEVNREARHGDRGQPVGGRTSRTSASSEKNGGSAERVPEVGHTVDHGG